MTVYEMSVSASLSRSSIDKSCFDCLGYRAGSLRDVFPDNTCKIPSGI